MIRELTKPGTKTIKLRSKWSQVRIYPSPRGEHVVIWRQGKREHRKSFANPAYARGFAEAVLTDLDNGRDALIQVDHRVNAERLYHVEQESGLTVEELLDEWKRLRKMVGPEQDRTAPEIPAHDVNGYMDSLGDVSKKHAATVRARITSFVSEAPARPDLGFCLSWLQAKKDPLTRNHFLGALKSYFQWLVSRHKARFNPFKEIDRWDVPRQTPEILTPDQLRAVLQATPDRLVPFVVLGAFCGIRVAEILRMTWGMVDFIAGEVRLPPGVTKCKIGRHVPLPECAIAWLFPHRGDDVAKVCPLANPHEALAPKLREAGVELPHNALRHSACSYLMASVRDAGVVAEYLGNSREILRKHYLALVSSEDAKKWFDIRPASGEAPTP